MSTPALTLLPDGVRVGDAVARLTRAERALLGWLVAHPGAPQSARLLLREVWRYREGVTSRTVVSTMHRLRAKLEAAGGAGWIRTVPGLGYALQPPERPVTDLDRLVGREAELAMIAGWFGGSGRVLLVTGPPGVGKSALVAAALPGLPRVDLGAATLGGALDALDACAGPAVFVDDADPVLAELGSHLGRAGRRVVVTCRYAVDIDGAERLHLAPLPPAAARELLDRRMASRFPTACPSAAERHRRVVAAAGNPARLRRILWRTEGAGAPPGLDRHRTEGETLAWGASGLSAQASTALARLAAVPCPVDDESAGVLVGVADPRPVLAGLRDRGLVTEDDGCWSVPDALRAELGPVSAVDANAVDGLRRWIVRQAPAGAVDSDLHRLGARYRAAWGLFTWAADHTHDPGELATLIQGLDHHALWNGAGYDARPYLARAAAVLPDDDQWWILRRQARAEIRHGTPPEDDGVHARMASAVALADRIEPPAPMLARRSQVELLVASGRFGAAIAAARQAADLSRAAGDSGYESDARALEAVALMRCGRHGEARDAVRAARALDPEPDRPWRNAESVGRVLASTGQPDEGIRLLRAAGAALRDAGRARFALVLDADAWWTAWAIGQASDEDALGALEAVYAEDPMHTRRMLPSLAVIALATGRLERASAWLRRAAPNRETAAEVRAVGAAVHAGLGLGVRWDELPVGSPEADPAFALLCDGFAGAASVHVVDAALADHPGPLVQVLRRVLGRHEPG